MKTALILYGGGIKDGINKKTNDQYKTIIYQNKTENLDT